MRPIAGLAASCALVVQLAAIHGAFALPQRDGFATPGARELYDRARAARVANDFAIRNYSALSVKRLSLWIRSGSDDHERLTMRQENAARIAWQRTVGAWIDVTGGRAIAPLVSDRIMADGGDLDDLPDVPYFPGMESFGLGGGIAPLGPLEEHATINPLSDSGSQHYTFALGDSARMSVAPGVVFSIRELRFRPRSLASNLAIGSLYIDSATGQVVEAIYRLAVPVNLQASIADLNAHPLSADNKPPGLFGSALLPTVDYKVTAVVVEYGLLEGNHWLPRTRSYDGVVDAATTTGRVSVEERFSYTQVNGPDTLPPIPPRANRACKSGTAIGIVGARYEVHLPVAVRLPCADSTLLTSPDLPASIVDPAEGVFGSAGERAARVAAALPMSAQPDVRVPISPPTFHYGLFMSRYNRVEGFATGLGVDQQFGGGYLASGEGRYGFADRQGSGKLSLGRTNFARTLSFSLYDQLTPASDWGDPFSVGSSLRALVLGHDEGYYYRAAGASLSSTQGAPGGVSWRLFAERQADAPNGTTFTLGSSFTPNLTAERGDFAGASMVWSGEQKWDDDRLVFTPTVRLEGAAEDLSPSGAGMRDLAGYGRASVELGLSRDIGSWVSGSVDASAGSTIGTVPTQRRWYLGGLETVRGESPATSQSGTAFWLERVEVGLGPRAIRVDFFSDVGWTGNRATPLQVGRPLSGVGTGLSLLDGLIHLDVARGLYPREQWRFDLRIGGR